MATNNALNVGLSGASGTGNFAGTTSPSFTTPSLGVADATSINKMAITAPATSSTLAVADGKALTCSNTMTFTSTDGASVAFGAGGTVAYSTSGLLWSGVAGTSQAAAVDSGYIIQNAGATTVTLPAVFAVGSRVAIAGLGAAGWILEPAAGDNIQVGSSNATTSVTSANQYDQIEVVGLVANKTWGTRFVMSAGLTIV